MRAMRALVPLALATILLTGCGKDGAGPEATPTPTDNGVSVLTADQILERATTALKAAKSFRMKGELSLSEGEKLKLDVNINNTDTSGTIEVNGAAVEILKVGTDLYFKGSDAFWKSIDKDNGEKIAILLKDKWAKAPTSDKQLSAFASIVDPDKLLDPDGTITKGSAKDINGTPAIGLVTSKADGGTLYVATTGEPYPLRLEGPPGEEAIDLSEFGATFDIKTPPTAEVVDMEKVRTVGSGLLGQNR